MSQESEILEDYARWLRDNPGKSEYGRAAYAARSRSWPKSGFDLTPLPTSTWHLHTWLVAAAPGIGHVADALVDARIVNDRDQAIALITFSVLSLSSKYDLREELEKLLGLDGPLTEAETVLDSHIGSVARYVLRIRLLPHEFDNERERRAAEAEGV